MARKRHAIEVALDFARMPALARDAGVGQLPPNIVEIMCIAAGSAAACEDASRATGQPVNAVVEAARFYLQHLLFHPEADSFRVLGLQPGDSRAAARVHMRWLMEWLHPDRNRGLEAVYAERVLSAWREVSNARESGGQALPPSRPRPKRMRVPLRRPRLPWIQIRPLQPRRYNWPKWLGLVLVAAVLAISFLYLYVGPARSSGHHLLP